MTHQHSQRSFFLAPSELTHLKLLIQANRTPQAVARRAQLIEASHTHPDWDTKQMARALQRHESWVRKWLRRWQETHSLQDAPDQARPAGFPRCLARTRKLSGLYGRGNLASGAGDRTGSSFSHTTASSVPITSLSSAWSFAPDGRRYRVADGLVCGQCYPRKRFVDFRSFLETVIVPEALQSGVQTVSLVLDNGSTHTPKQLTRWIQELATTSERKLSIQLFWLPVNASWLDQLEIGFSLLQRKPPQPNHFCSLDELEQAIGDFITRYNQTANSIK